MLKRELISRIDSIVGIDHSYEDDKLPAYTVLKFYNILIVEIYQQADTGNWKIWNVRINSDVESNILALNLI